MMLLRLDASIFNSLDRRRGIDRAKSIVEKDPNIASIAPLVVGFLNSIKSKPISLPYMNEGDFRALENLFNIKVRTDDRQESELHAAFINITFELQPKVEAEEEKDIKLPSIDGKFSWINYEMSGPRGMGSDYVNQLTMIISGPREKYRYDIFLENKECMGEGRYIPGTSIRMSKEEKKEKKEEQKQEEQRKAE